MLRWLLAASVLAAASCAPKVGVTHQDYGDCQRSVRHMHNSHVFLGDYHDHALCEWVPYDPVVQQKKGSE